MHDFTIRNKMIKLYKWLDSQQNAYVTQNPATASDFYYQKSLIACTMTSGKIITKEAHIEISKLFVNYAQYLINNNFVQNLRTINEMLGAAFEFNPQNRTIGALYQSHGVPHNYRDLVASNSEENEYLSRIQNLDMNHEEIYSRTAFKGLFFSYSGESEHSQISNTSSQIPNQSL